MSISVEAVIRRGDDADPAAMDCTGCSAPSVVMLLVENTPARDAAVRAAMTAAATDEAKVEIVYAGMRAGNDPIHLCQGCVDKLAGAFMLFAARPKKRTTQPPSAWAKEQEQMRETISPVDTARLRELLARPRYPCVEELVYALPALLDVLDAACELVDNWRDTRAEEVSSARLERAVDAARGTGSGICP